MVRIALGQINTTVGDLAGNVDRMAAAAAEATAAGADLVCFPELAVTGYPPEDLVLRPGFVADNLAALRDLAAANRGRLRRTRGVRRSHRPRTAQRGRPAVGRPGGRPVPQGPAAQLRRVRRAAVLRPRRSRLPGRVGVLGARHLGVRGRVDARPAVDALRGRGRGDHPEHQRVAVPPATRSPSGWRCAGPAPARPARGSST